jgi:hypothetical protein
MYLFVPTVFVQRLYTVPGYSVPISALANMTVDENIDGFICLFGLIIISTSP